ncbi:hypothetical protein QN382_23720, partial [Pseudomonas sp. 10B1]|uniref:hypothetical protein n=1 Tax=unclassified Pseudomonas TaxID=196821 RepID=UPI002B231978
FAVVVSAMSVAVQHLRRGDIDVAASGEAKVSTGLKYPARIGDIATGTCGQVVACFDPSRAVGELSFLGIRAVASVVRGP